MQSDQLIGGLFPLFAILNRFSLCTDLVLQLQVGLHFRLDLQIEVTLVLKEPVTCVAEPFIDLRIILLRSESDGFPHFLNLNQLFGGLIPLLARHGWGGYQLFGLDTQFGLQVEIFLLLLLQCVEILLMTFVDF